MASPSFCWMASPCWWMTSPCLSCRMTPEIVTGISVLFGLGNVECTRRPMAGKSVVHSFQLVTLQVHSLGVTV